MLGRNGYRVMLLSSEVRGYGSTGRDDSNEHVVCLGEKSVDWHPGRRGGSSAVGRM